MSKRVDDLADVAPGPFCVDVDGAVCFANGQSGLVPYGVTTEHAFRISAALALYPELARLANAAIARRDDNGLVAQWDYDEALDALLARIGGGQ